MTAQPPLLIVDDDPEMRAFLTQALEVHGHVVTPVESGQRALELLQDLDVGVVIADVFLKGINGVELLRRVRELTQTTQVVLTGRDVPTYTVVNAIKQGALDFVEKPVDPDYFLLVVGKAIAHFRLMQENQALKRVFNLREGRLDDMVAESAPMKELLKNLDLVSPTDLTVLIEGESGVGKELVANRIHQISPRHDKPFIAVNCGAIQETLLESELFGHEKGAFTGASADHRGLFEVAHNGTLFLDEIGEMSLELQVKLLRVLERSEFRRVGGTKTIKVDVRVVAATNKHLSEEVKQKRFREDLYYRLNVIHLEVAPLRDRVADVPPLVGTFMAGHHRKGLPKRTMSSEALEELKRYAWPGNVRELRNVVERCLILARDEVIRVSDLPAVLRSRNDDDPGSGESGSATGFDLSMPLAEVERRHILRVLESLNGNKVQTAKLLGINVKTLYNKLKSYDKAKPSG
jgi:two-component system, NtrC family, nitrogen regulation response regulator NtrX